MATRGPKIFHMLDQDDQPFFSTYGTAAAASSMRQLSLGYTGPCVRIRRSSDNAETDIGFKNGWIDQAAITSYISTNSAYVTTWYDQSGHSRHWTCATATQQPRIVNAGTFDKIGNIPALMFDATPRWMINSSYTAANWSNTAYGIFLAGTIEAAAYQIMLYMGNYNTYTPNWHWVGMDYNITPLECTAYDGTNSITQSITYTAGTKVVIAHTANTSSPPYASTFNNGNEITGTPKASPALNTATYWCMNRNFANFNDSRAAHYQECIIYNVDVHSMRDDMRFNINKAFNYY